jgi:hypothetical protein
MNLQVHPAQGVHRFGTHAVEFGHAFDIDDERTGRSKNAGNK